MDSNGTCLDCGKPLVLVALTALCTSRPCAGTAVGSVHPRTLDRPCFHATCHRLSLRIARPICYRTFYIEDRRLEEAVDHNSDSWLSVEALAHSVVPEAWQLLCASVISSSTWRAGASERDPLRQCDAGASSGFGPVLVPSEKAEEDYRHLMPGLDLNSKDRRGLSGRTVGCSDAAAAFGSRIQSLTGQAIQNPTLDSRG